MRLCRREREYRQFSVTYAVESQSFEPRSLNEADGRNRAVGPVQAFKWVDQSMMLEYSPAACEILFWPACRPYHSCECLNAQESTGS